MSIDVQRRLQVAIRLVCAASFVTPGVAHFTHTDAFVAIMPDYLPWHLELVWLSGVFEILGGVGLLVPATRRFAAWGLLALLVAVFPANLNMALNEIYLDGMPQSRFALWARLPFQLVFMLEVWAAGLWVPGGSESGPDGAE